MNYEWLDEYCLKKPGAQKDFKVEWSAVRYLIGSKMFVMQYGDKQGKPIISVKLAPGHGAVLRQRFEDIVPGYYMNKTHWNSLYLEGDVPDDIVRQMVDESYGLVFAGLTKSLQREILEENI